MTQLFTYLLTQHRTAATPTSVVYFSVLIQQVVPRRPRWPSTIAENVGSTSLACSVHTRGQGKDFKLILKETFGRDFSAFVIIVELWRTEVARSGNFVSNFCIFFGKTITPKLSLLRRSHPKSAKASPPAFGSRCSTFHPNQFTFGGVIAERVKTVFVP